MSTFKEYRQFIIHPTTEDVDRINEFTFNNYSKDWVINRGFLPVLRHISNDEFRIKLYFKKDGIQERRMMEEYCASYFSEKFDSLRHCITCGAITIPLENWVKSEDVIDCKSSSELEYLLIRNLTDDSYVGCSDGGVGLTMWLSHLRNRFNNWHKLVNDDILTVNYVDNGDEEDEISEEVQLLLDCVYELAQKHGLTPDYQRILKYIDEISIIDIDTSEKRTRKGKFLLNKQYYDESMEKNGPNRLVYTPEFMDRINGIWDFSNAGQTFVMPYHKSKTDSDKKK